jgi:hypothetical protein
MATIPERLALEVFVNDIGTITIRQDVDVQTSKDEPMVVVHPDDVSTLISALEDARRRALRGAAEEQDEVTVPAIVDPSTPGSSP